MNEVKYVLYSTKEEGFYCEKYSYTEPYFTGHISQATFFNTEHTALGIKDMAEMKDDVIVKKVSFIVE